MLRRGFAEQGYLLVADFAGRDHKLKASATHKDAKKFVARTSPNPYAPDPDICVGISLIEFYSVLM
jgi:hypothetical protein